MAGFEGVWLQVSCNLHCVLCELGIVLRHYHANQHHTQPNRTCNRTLTAPVYAVLDFPDVQCLQAAVMHSVRRSAGCCCEQDVVALIAYEQPEQSPLAHLLEVSQREVVADAVNAAILQVASSGSNSSLVAAAGSNTPQVRHAGLPQ
jgi:hypothetical protein